MNLSLSMLKAVDELAGRQGGLHRSGPIQISKTSNGWTGVANEGTIDIGAPHLGENVE